MATIRFRDNRACVRDFVKGISADGFLRPTYAYQTLDIVLDGIAVIVDKKLDPFTLRMMRLDDEGQRGRFDDYAHRVKLIGNGHRSLMRTYLGYFYPREALTMGLILRKGISPQEIQNIENRVGKSLRVEWHAEMNRYLLIRNKAFKSARYNDAPEVKDFDRGYIQDYAVTFSEADGDLLRMTYTREAKDHTLRHTFMIYQGTNIDPIRSDWLDTVNQSDIDWALASIYSECGYFVSISFGKATDGGKLDLSSFLSYATVNNDVDEQGACLFAIIRDIPVTDDGSLVILRNSDPTAVFVNRHQVMTKMRLRASTPRAPFQDPTPIPQNHTGRFIDMTVDTVARAPSSVNEDWYLDTMSIDGESAKDQALGRPMVLGLTKGLTPIAFQDWVLSAERMRNTFNMKGGLPYGPHLPGVAEQHAMRRQQMREISGVEYGMSDDFGTSWLSHKSRVYIHQGQGGFRFLFAVRYDVLFSRPATKGYHRASQNTKPVWKHPALLMMSHFVPSKGLTEMFSPTWRGMGRDTAQAIANVPGLGIALTNAINEAKLQYGKVTDTPDALTNILSDTDLPESLTIAFPGWGKDEVQRMDSARSRYVSKDDDFGGKLTERRNDGMFGWHRGKSNTYRAQSTPFLRALDMATGVFNNAGPNKIIGYAKDKDVQRVATGRAVDAGLLEGVAAPECATLSPRVSRQIDLD